MYAFDNMRDINRIMCSSKVCVLVDQEQELSDARKK